MRSPPAPVKRAIPVLSFSMATIPVQDRFAPDAPFKYISGDPSLDFVNTVNWTSRGLGRDRISSYERVLEWALGAGVIDAVAVRRLERIAAQHPRRAAAALDAAREARQVLRDVFAGIAAERHSTSTIDKLNALLADAAQHLRMVRDRGSRLTRGWEGLGDSPASLLWPVVWTAADLVSSDDVERLRMCAGEDCGWFYIDRSRNGLRRWCEMSVCGTTEKNRRRAGR